ncbi:uncharacterized protein LOC110039090 [Phalaenopsis equestris]|uniref:uncharacterized protein LOC110039090 n=1 Tax=Phalaenopsis equestris TaxID=78828 RepID=UPI0009E52D62|nr:uncharacterized protein LOC110039090 [Phalaenopsis equestris]
MRGKYCKDQHATLVERKTVDSKIWGKMLNIRQTAENLFIWDLGKGDISFWIDNWCPKDWLSPISSVPNTDLKVAECWEDEDWSLLKLSNILQANSVTKITSIKIDRSKPDKIIWQSFSNQSLTKDINSKVFQWEHISWGTIIWNNFLSTSMSFFCWRAFHKLLPTDDILKLKGLRGPSKCRLCLHEEESLPHLFFECNFVQLVWHQLLSHLNIENKLFTWDKITICWHTWHKRNYASIPLIVAWFIWMERNKAKFEDDIPKTEKIIRNKLSYVHKMNKLKRFPNISNSYSSGQPDQIQVYRVYWKPPDHNTVKITTDGSFNNSGVGVGGVYRNHLGKCLLQFYIPVMVVDALETELVAVYWALKIAKMTSWYNLWLEVDSTNLLNYEEHVPWHLTYWIKKIRELNS